MQQAEQDPLKIDQIESS